METVTMSISNQWFQTCLPGQPHKQGGWLLLLKYLTSFALQKDSCPWQVVVGKELSQFLVLQGQSWAENPTELKNTTQHHCLMTKSIKRLKGDRSQKQSHGTPSDMPVPSKRMMQIIVQWHGQHSKTCQNFCGVAAIKGQDDKWFSVSLDQPASATCLENPQCNPRKCLF